MRTSCIYKMPGCGREFFDMARECCLRVVYLEEMVEREAERVGKIRAARGWLGELEGAALYVTNNMERRLELYTAEYREAAVVCEAAERIVERVPSALDEKVLRMRYLQGYDMDEILSELRISRGTVYNAERRAIGWVDANGMPELLERLRVGWEAARNVVA